MNISKQITQVAKLSYGDFLVLKAFGCTVYLLKPSRVFTVSWTRLLKRFINLILMAATSVNLVIVVAAVLFEMRWESLLLVFVLIMAFVPI